jgi:DNA-binding NarL/FixJ family response regulator
MNAFRILLADDHPISRLGLRSVVDSHESWEVCGEAEDGQDAVDKCNQLKPDLIILDICMQRFNGMDVARQILKDNPAQRILILTNVDSEKTVEDFLHAGVCGWVLKSDGIGALTAAIETLQQHYSIPGAQIPAVLVGGRWKGNPLPTAARVPRLSPREREVLQLLAEGNRCKDVAATLNISLKTAETHRTNLMSKLNLHSLAKLVIYAVRNEVIRVPFAAPCQLPEPPDSLAAMTLETIS